MALIVRGRDGRITVTGRKHNGKTLEQVAKEDLGYLKFVRKKAFEDLSDDVHDALDKTLKKHGVNLKDL